ncbi:MAG: inosine/xanthosine triphosphatase [Dehalococcoidales bacterium]|nr:inosine/xanthosine triphosphatase [Dehalococcoidales bacterium]
MKLIAVGSENPVKLQATAQAFKLMFPEEKWEVKGIKVSSGVADQPMSDEESIQGARNRATTALANLGADFGVGLEGGLQQIAGRWWFTSGWVVIVNKAGEEGIGSSISMEIPEKLMAMIQEGKELGDVSDHFFQTTESKRGQGHTGLRTNNLITRTDIYKDALLSALSRFLHPELF